MPLPSFIEKVDDFPHLRIVKLQGEIDHHTLLEVQNYLKKIKQDDVTLSKSAVLDLRKVTRVDTAAIAGLLAPPASAREMGARARARVARDHSWAHTAERMAAAYAQARRHVSV